MSLINGVLVLLLCQCTGEAIKAYFNLSLPGPVLGMFILFLGLCLFGDTPKALIKSSQTLIPLLGLMFLPTTAGLFFLGAEFNKQWPAIIIAIALGSLLSLIFNGLMMKWLSQRKIK